MKVKLFDKLLIKEYLSILVIINLVLSLVLIFVNIENKIKLNIGIAFGIILIILYLFLWYKANTLKKLILEINNTQVEIVTGDIFEENIKVIPFNEYFDTNLESNIISENSLHCKFLERNKTNIEDLNKIISESNSLKSIEDKSDIPRSNGKNIKYQLGTIIEYNNYFLVAFTKFDSSNRAILTFGEYIDCLSNFWKEIDINNNGRTISLPLMGAGMTRIKDVKPSKDDLLEWLICSFKMSDIKLPYNSKIRIVLLTKDFMDINLYRIKRNY